MSLWNKIKQYVVWAIVFALPWQLRHTFVFAEYQGQFFEHASISLYLTDILIAGLLIGWALSGLVQKSKFSWGPMWMSVPLGAVIGWMWVSVVWSIDPVVASWAAGHWLLFGLLYLYLVNNVTDIRYVLAPLAWGVALQGGLAVAQYFVNHSLGLWWLGESVLDPSVPGIPRILAGDVAQLRSHGTLPHANLLGGYLAVGLVMMTPLLVKAWHIWLRWGVWLAYGLGLAGLVLSASRSAWVVWLVATVVVFIYLWTVDRRMLVGVVRSGVWVAMVMVVLVATQWGVLSARFDFGNRLEQKSALTRLEQLDQFVDVYRQHPIFGVGAGQYQLALRDRGGDGLGWRYDAQIGGWVYSEGVSVWQLEPVHNVFLMAVADLGIVGLVLWLWLIGGVVWHLGLAIRRRSGWLGVIWLVSVAAVVALGMVDHYVWTLQQGRLLIFLVIGVSAVWIGQSGYNKEDGTRSS